MYSTSLHLNNDIQARMLQKYLCLIGHCLMLMMEEYRANCAC